MSDTPKHQQAADGGEELGAELKWNSEADGYNQWDSLGENEKAELIAAFISANARDLAPPTKPLMAGYQQELCSAFFIRRATPPTYTRWISGRHGSGVRENAGTAATIMVCGTEWTSRVPRTETECAQTNAWAEKIISQNA